MKLRGSVGTDPGPTGGRALPDGDLAETIEPIMWLGAAETCQERLDDAIRHLLRALAIARAAGQDHGVAG